MGSVYRPTAHDVIFDTGVKLTRQNSEVELQ